MSLMVLPQTQDREHRTSDLPRTKVARRLRPVILLAIVAAASACYAPPPGPSDSTPSLAGVISDDVTNRPIGGANISVGGQTTTSTVDGYYVTSTLERGSARIRVSHPNYVTTERQVDVNQYLQKADFRLQPK